MSLSQLRRELQELKEAADKKPNNVQRESLKEHTERIQKAMQGYTDAGVFGEGDRLKINIVSDNDVSSDLMKRWNNRHTLTLEEHTKLYYELGIYEEPETN